MMTQAPRYPTLDLLRLVAIGMTVLAHTPSVVARVPGLRLMQNSLWLGVDLFMLISGWLLGGQLLREQAKGGIATFRFYVKRWFRTLPAYWFMLALLYHLPHAPEFRGPLPLWDVVAHATFIHVYAGMNHYMVSWSLCVEEHFYLLLPLLIGVTRRASVRSMVLLVVALEVLAVVTRALAFGPTQSIPGLSHQRCDGLFLGFLFAFIDVRAPALWARLGSVARWSGWVGGVGTIAVLCSVEPAPNPWMFVGAPTVGTWTFALVFLPCVHEASRWSRFSFKGLAYLGGLTYAIYLTHSVIPRPLVELVGVSGSVVGVAWRFLLMAGAALFVHHLVERPFLSLRQRLLARWTVRSTGAPS
jgi:peptidoglycan/LPS O-acetylase OafA/YrhL